MIRKIFPLGKMMEILKKYSKNDIVLSKHYRNYLNSGRRDIDMGSIINFLFTKEFYFVEKQINS